ncbi:uncharacterized protein LOC123894454 isoform X1 [Trifolium pratense]|uniref:uncharacterized protein LOC123894454 isoform X1 n=2 Tax=Trifolium pratense TaxID=57577 RepID=UPI001E693544|nr:uncharacterized protein LOC123894454 isoform X1 [Trifolium pratense]
MERPLDVDPLKFSDTWNTNVPLKMVTTILRKFQNKISTKDNLPKRGVLIKLQANCASYGCRVTESSALHIFSLNVTYTSRNIALLCRGWGSNPGHIQFLALPSFVNFHYLQNLKVIQ